MPPYQPTAFDRHFQSPAQTPCCVTPSSNNIMQYRNFRLLSIAYAFCLGLVPTYPETTSVAQDPLGFRWIRFSLIVSLLIPAFSLPSCPAVLPVCLQPAWNAPLPMLAHPATSVLYLSPGYFRRRASRPVSYYALFEWWLLLSQHPGCLGSSTSFST